MLTQYRYSRAIVYYFRLNAKKVFARELPESGGAVSVWRGFRKRLDIGQTSPKIHPSSQAVGMA